MRHDIVNDAVTAAGTGAPGTVASDGVTSPDGMATVDGAVLDGERRTGVELVQLRGEIDLLTAPDVSARLDPLTGRPKTDLILDLRAVTFMDCSGLSALCRARRRLLGGGGRLRLIVDHPSVPRLLKLARLDGAFETLPLPGLTAHRGPVRTGAHRGPVRTA